MSGEFKGTPGQWKYRGPLGEIYTEEHGVIADLMVSGHEEENGNLMAAAPELLEALQQLIRAAENIGGEHVTGLMDLDNAVMFASIKVAKALGVFKNQ